MALDFLRPAGWSAMRADDGSPESPELIRPSRGRAPPRHVVRRYLRVFLSIPRSSSAAISCLPLPPSAIASGYGLAPGGVGSRRRESPPSSRRRCYREPGHGGSCLRIFPTLPRSDDPGSWRRRDCRLARFRLTARLRCTRSARSVGASVRDGCDGAGDARGVSLTPHGCAKTSSSISTYRNLARTVEPYLAGDCTLASYRHYVQSLPFYTRRRETRGRVLGRAFEFFSPITGQVVVPYRLRRAPAPGLVVGRVHDPDRERSRPQSACRLAQARAGSHRMRGKKARALQWRAGAAAGRSRLSQIRNEELVNAGIEVLGFRLIGL